MGLWGVWVGGWWVWLLLSLSPSPPSCWAWSLCWPSRPALEMARELHGADGPHGAVLDCLKQLCVAAGGAGQHREASRYAQQGEWDCA